MGDSDDDLLPRYPPAFSRGALASDLLNLPPLPPFFGNGLKAHRKRTHSTSNSSDMPTFSSDDLENADIHNYEEGPRSKRIVRGPWWKSPSKGPVGRSRLHRSYAPPQSPCALKSTKTSDLERNKDSGVWGLWSETDSLDGFFAEESNPPVAVFTANPLPGECACWSSQEAQAADEVVQLVSDNNDRINLSNMSLSKLHSSTLEPLTTLIRRPPLVNDVKYRTPVSAHQYQNLRPSIRLFLSGNSLSTLPLGLWNLQNLTFLSLRNNRLRELPPCIVNLPNLQHLNVAANHIRWLPWELLSMLKTPSGKGRLEELILLPNPIVSPISHPDSESRLTDAITDRSNFVRKRTATERWQHSKGRHLEPAPFYEIGLVASSAISYSKPDGASERGSWEHDHAILMACDDSNLRDEFRRPNTISVPASLPNWELNTDSTPEPINILDSIRLSRSSTVPSLQELALRVLTTVMASTEAFRASCPPTRIDDILSSLGIPEMELPTGLVDSFERCAAVATELALLGQRPGHGLASSTAGISAFSSPTSRGPISPMTPQEFIRSSPFPLPSSSCHDPMEKISTRCGVCQSPYVLHRASWIEYWSVVHVSDTDSVERPSPSNVNDNTAQIRSPGPPHSPSPFRTRAPDLADDLIADSMPDFEYQNFDKSMAGVWPFVRKVCCTACARPGQVDGWTPLARQELRSDREVYLKEVAEEVIVEEAIGPDQH